MKPVTTDSSGACCCSPSTRTTWRISGKSSWFGTEGWRRCSRTRASRHQTRRGRHACRRIRPNSSSAYEARQKEMIEFLRRPPSGDDPALPRRVSDPPAPRGIQAHGSGGLHERPRASRQGHDRLLSYIPTYNPKSGNFYIRAAIEDPRPILGHEGIPGHFLQISIANHVNSEIRRHHHDSVFAEGWALYTEEMLVRDRALPREFGGTGADPPRLSRYRSARIGVDVNLHTGRWSFEQAVKYFMDAGGLDREAAEGEAAGAASSPSQKISYITGKWQVMRLLARYRDSQGSQFRLGAFHDQLLGYGTLPLSVVEWLMFDDDSSLRAAMQSPRAPAGRRRSTRPSISPRPSPRALPARPSRSGSGSRTARARAASVGPAPRPSAREETRTR